MLYYFFTGIQVDASLYSFYRTFIPAFEYLTPLWSRSPCFVYNFFRNVYFFFMGSDPNVLQGMRRDSAHLYGVLNTPSSSCHPNYSTRSFGCFFYAIMGENWMTKMLENWEITDISLHMFLGRLFWCQEKWHRYAIEIN